MSAEHIHYDFETNDINHMQQFTSYDAERQQKISEDKLQFYLIDVYGEIQTAAVTCLEAAEAVGLLNQAARFALGYTLNAQRSSLRHSFKAMQTDLHTAGAYQPLYEYGATSEAVFAMRRGIATKDRRKISYDTPKSVVNGKIIERGRQAAKLTATGEICGRNWYLGAVCTVLNPEVFFTGDSKPEDRQTRAVAEMACRHCPVRKDCLQEALEEGFDFGFWGGVDEKERRAIKRRNKGKRAIY